MSLPDRRAGPSFDRPIFIVSPPRSGSSMLFLALAQAPDVFTIGGESHDLIETVQGLHPVHRGWSSNRLTAADAVPAITSQLYRRFHAALRDRNGRPPLGLVRMVEKTPKNSLRIGFFHAMFPDARFVYLYRDPRATMSSMLEAWRSGRFTTYPRLPGWGRPAWSLLLTPNWRDLIGWPLEHIVAHQWATTTRLLLEDLGRLSPRHVAAIDYDELVAYPGHTLRRLEQTLDLQWHRPDIPVLPLSPTVVTPPASDKWRRDHETIEAVMPIVHTAEEAAKRFVEAHRS